MGTINTAARIKGITVILYEKTQTGRDEARQPIYEETPVQIDNVLVSPATEQEILDSLNLTGRRAVYTLALPKGDAHDWTDVRVSFFGSTYKTIGAPVEGIETMIPLEWNRKVRCEIING